MVNTRKGVYNNVCIKAIVIAGIVPNKRGVRFSEGVRKLPFFVPARCLQFINLSGYLSRPRPRRSSIAFSVWPIQLVVRDNCSGAL